MKKLLSIVLFIAVVTAVLSIGASAFAAEPQDLLFSKDAVLKASFVKYGNITVKSGVTLTIDKSSGFEITGNITVEEGAKIVCNGTGNGGFNFMMRSKDAQITGMELYFKYKTDYGTEIRRVAGGFATIAAIDEWNWNDSPTPCFKWEESVQGWCLTGETNRNLSDEPVYHSERDMGTAEQFADRLNRLGLFKGTGAGYDLFREGSRAEALVMLIRMLGKEEEALNGTWTHPFTDVPEWADKYVGYAYKTGLTQGTGATTFGTGTASAQMYYTFVLRALGKADSEGYKIYDHAAELMGETGILSTENDPYEICEKSFWRSDMVAVSYRALSAQTVSGETLGEKLIADGVFSESDYRDAMFGPMH